MASSSPAVIDIVTPDATTSANFLTLSGTAIGLNFNLLSIYDNETLVGLADVTNGRWSLSVLPTSGTNVYKAVGAPTADPGVTSNSVTIIGMRTSPIVTIDQAAGKTGQPALHLSGTVSTPGFGTTYVAGTTVQLLDNGLALGSAAVGTDGRWSADVTLPASGSNSVTASDTDLVGNSDTASIVETLKTTVPTVTISTGGGPTNQPLPILSGTTTASAPGSAVTITEDGTAIGKTIVGVDGTWMYAVTLDPGSHVFQAIDDDGFGHQATSNSVTLVGLRTPPIITIDQAGGKTDQAGLHLSGTVSTPGFGATYVAGTTITLSDNNLVLGSAVVGADGRWNSDVTLPASGWNSVTASDTDLAGNIGDAFVTETLKTTVPTVTISDGGGPTDQSWAMLSGTTTASDPGDFVTIFEDGTAIGRAMVGQDGDWMSSVTLDPGGHAFQATFADGYGHMATSNSVTLTSVRTSPVVTIDQASGDTGQAALHLSGTVSTPGFGTTYVAGTTITLTDNRLVLGSALVGADGRWSSDVTLPVSGSNTVIASDTDLTGNTGDGFVTETLNTTVPPAAGAPTAPTEPTAPNAPAPRVSFDGAPQLTGGTTATLSGTVSDATGVAIYQGGAELGTAGVNGDGTWTFSHDFGIGTYDQLTAVATDDIGLSATASALYDLVTGASGRRSIGEIMTKDASGAVSAVTTIAADGSVGAETVSNGDGTATSTGYENGQGLFSIGNDVMTGNGMREDFVFQPTMGHARVTDFVADGAGHDTLTLSSQDFANAVQVLDSTTMNRGSAVIHISPDDTIRLVGVTRADLAQHRSDFAFTP